MIQPAYMQWLKRMYWRIFWISFWMKPTQILSFGFFPPLIKLIALTKHLASHIIGAISNSIRLLDDSASTTGSAATEDLINLIIVFYSPLTHSIFPYRYPIISLISPMFIRVGMLTQGSTVWRRWRSGCRSIRERLHQSHTTLSSATSLMSSVPLPLTLLIQNPLKVLSPLFPFQQRLACWMPQFCFFQMTLPFLISNVSDGQSVIWAEKIWHTWNHTHIRNTLRSPHHPHHHHHHLLLLLPLPLLLPLLLTMTQPFHPTHSPKTS